MPRIELPAQLEIGSVGVEVKAEVDHIRDESGVSVRQLFLNGNEVELDDFAKQDIADEIETLYPE